MQFLMSSSEEHGLSKGLSIIEGKVRKNKGKNNYINKVPVVGWNYTFFNKNSEKKFNKLNSVVSKKKFYYVHSFSAEPKNKRNFSLL